MYVNKNKNKPDNRSDNAEKLQEMIHDTLDNIHEAEDRMEWASNHEQKNIKAKNKRRKEAVEGFREEIKDEIQQTKVGSNRILSKGNVHKYRQTDEALKLSFNLMLHFNFIQYWALTVRNVLQSLAGNSTSLPGALNPPVK